MLKTKEDCWPDDDNPSERYLYVTGPNCFKTRIVILEDNVYADDTEIMFSTGEELVDWIEVLKKAWRIKAEQDKKGWRARG